MKHESMPLLEFAKNLAKMQECILGLADLFPLISDLIDEEHEAISRHDLDKVEEIAAKKLGIGHEQDALFSQLRYVSANIADQARSTGIIVKDNVQNISSNFALIDEMISVFHEKGGNTSSIQLSRQTLESAYERYLDLHQKCHAKIEVNKRVLSKLLAQRQENYRFWQEVAADLMSGYNAGGKQKSNRSASVLNVKA